MSKISFEIFPPKHGDALKNIDSTLEILTDLKPEFISITFGAGGSVKDNKTIELAKRIKNEFKIQPVVHLTCLNYSRLEIETILLELEDAGINKILALRGDKNPNYPVKNDFHYAKDLISYIKLRNTNFSVFGACYPETHLEAKDKIVDLHNLRDKVNSGVDLLISQLFFDNNVFFDFLNSLKIMDISTPVEAGIMPVTNKAQIERMVNMCGASLPLKYRKILEKYEDNKEALFDAGMAYATNQIIDLLTSGVDGIHLYTMNNPAVAKRICNNIKNFI